MEDKSNLDKALILLQSSLQQNDSTVVSQGNEQGRMTRKTNICVHTHTTGYFFLVNWVIPLWELFSKVWLITVKTKLFSDNNYSRSTYIKEIMAVVHDFITIREAPSPFLVWGSVRDQVWYFKFFSLTFISVKLDF